MNKVKTVYLILLVLLVLGIIFQKQLLTHTKIVLFISEEFPQIPVKPLGLVTGSPQYQWVEYDTVNGKVVADLYLPADHNRPAVILAMGVNTDEKNKALIRHFADTMARLGYMVLWPRLEVLDRGESLPEEPETFVEGFKYLSGLPQTNPERITFVGFSVGSSTALVAASNPQIKNQISALVFFGGQFDIFDYLFSLASRTYQKDGSRVEWNVADGARDHAKDLLQAKNATAAAQIFETDDVEKIENILSSLPPVEKMGLQQYNPRSHLPEFTGKLFILHDVSDNYVPYVESVRLSEALPKEQIGAFVITDLFDHVQPNRPINLGELFKLYGFLYKTLSYL